MEMEVVTSPYPGATAPECGARYPPAAPGSRQADWGRKWILLHRSSGKQRLNACSPYGAHFCRWSLGLPSQNGPLSNRGPQSQH